MPAPLAQETDENGICVDPIIHTTTPYHLSIHRHAPFSQPKGGENKKEMAAAAGATRAPSRRRRRHGVGHAAPRLALAALLLACLGRCGRAQNVTTYAVHMGGADGDDVAWGMGLDGGGSAFVVGGFRSRVFSIGQRVDLPNAHPTPGAGGSRSSDAFVAKVTRFGQLAWAIGLGGWGDDVAAAVAVEPGNNAPAYVVGRFESAELVIRAPDGTGAGAGAQASLIKAPDAKTWTGLGNALVAKFDSKGAVAWALQLGGEDGDDGAAAVAVDAARGRVYVAGTFASADLPLGGHILRNAGGATDGFVAALSTADGSVQWATGLQGAGLDRPTGLAVDAATGAVYVVGVSDSPTLALASAATQGQQQEQQQQLALGRTDDDGAPTAASAAAFVARLEGATGAVAWAQALGPAAAAVDPEVAAAAAASESVLVLLGQAPSAPALLSLDARTGGLRWRAAVTGAQRLVVDAAGANAYLAGVFTEPLPLGPVTLAVNAPRGGDLFVARVDAATGKVESGASFSGGDSARKAVGDMGLDAAGSVYLVGSYADGGLGFSTTLQPAALPGGGDSFLARVLMVRVCLWEGWGVGGFKIEIAMLCPGLVVSNAP
jgi:hypothetical protein